MGPLSFYHHHIHAINSGRASGRAWVGNGKKGGAIWYCFLGLIAFLVILIYIAVYQGEGERPKEGEPGSRGKGDMMNEEITINLFLQIVIVFCVLIIMINSFTVNTMCLCKFRFIILL